MITENKISSSEETKRGVSQETYQDYEQEAALKKVREDEISQLDFEYHKTSLVVAILENQMKIKQLQAEIKNLDSAKQLRTVKPS